MPLAHSGPVISYNQEGLQWIIYAYAEKNNKWEEAKKNAPTGPKPRVQQVYSLDILTLHPTPAENPPLATAHPNYWDALRSHSDYDADLWMDIELSP